MLKTCKTSWPTTPWQQPWRYWYWVGGLVDNLFQNTQQCSAQSAGGPKVSKVSLQNFCTLFTVWLRIALDPWQTTVLWDLLVSMHQHPIFLQICREIRASFTHQKPQYSMPWFEPDIWYWKFPWHYLLALQRFSYQRIS